MGFIVQTEDGEPVGSDPDVADLPMSGDILVMRHPHDDGPTWEVIRREFVNGETFVIVRPAGMPSVARF